MFGKESDILRNMEKFTACCLFLNLARIWTQVGTKFPNKVAREEYLFPESSKDSAGRRIEHQKDHGAQESARGPAPAKQEVSDTTTLVSPGAESEDVEATYECIMRRSSSGEWGACM